MSSMMRRSHKRSRPAPYERVKIKRWEFLEYLQGVPTLLVPQPYTERPVLDILNDVCTRRNVTGFSEESKSVNYSYGPAPNPYAWSFHTQGAMVYIVTAEVHWRMLFDLFPKFCPQEKLGAIIYLLLTITRLFCFFGFYAHQALGFFLPYPTVISSRFEVKPIPAPGDAIIGGPLDPRNIRGPAALEAARRAGYDMPV